MDIKREIRTISRTQPPGQGYIVKYRRGTIPGERVASIRVLPMAPQTATVPRG